MDSTDHDLVAGVESRDGCGYDSRNSRHRGAQPRPKPNAKPSDKVIIIAGESNTAQTGPPRLMDRREAKEGVDKNCNKIRSVQTAY